VKVLIATPLYDGRADREFITGLMNSHGLYHAWTCLEGQANISLARDMLAAQFLASDCTTLVFIDGDIGFIRKDLETLLASRHAVTSGMYPRKRAQEDWVFVPLGDDSEQLIEAGKPFPVKYTGAGFLKIERRVFTDLENSGRCPFYASGDGGQIRHFFGTGVLDGVFMSEDYQFCELAAQAGHRVHLDPRIRLRHVGKWTFERE
jgi:hypothetical protein